jgi:hypothetical protein
MFRAMEATTVAPAILGIEIDDRFMGQNPNYNIYAYAIPPGMTVEKAAYAVCRARHDFLTDTNHTWTIEHSEWWSEIVVRKTEESPTFAMKPWWVDDGPGALWFSEYWRIATPEGVAEEARELDAEVAKYAEQADQCRDTVRGRREAKRLRSLVSELERRARVTRDRWNHVRTLGN